MAFQRLLSGDFREAPAVPRPAALPATSRPLLRLSEAAAEWLTRETARGLAQRTLDDIRLVLWSVIEFAGCDPPQRELQEDFPAAYLHWLRVTPVAPRKAKTLPRAFARQWPRSFSNIRRGGPGPPVVDRSKESVITGRIPVPFFSFIGLPAPILSQRRAEPGHSSAPGPDPRDYSRMVAGLLARPDVDRFNDHAATRGTDAGPGVMHRHANRRGVDREPTERRRALAVIATKQNARPQDLVFERPGAGDCEGVAPRRHADGAIRHRDHAPPIGWPAGRSL